MFHASSRVEGIGGWSACFAPTADPARYVPRGATERALAALERALLDAAPALLLAPAGYGKTLLLRVLAARLCDRLHPVYLPHPGLSQGELFTFALGALRLPAGRHPEVELLEHAAELRRNGAGLLLLVDDADALDPAVARGLTGLAAVSHGGLRLAFAALDDERGERLRPTLGDARTVVLRSAMDAHETADYVRHRLGRLEEGDPRARLLAPETLKRIHALSGGVPACVPPAIARLAR